MIKEKVSFTSPPRKNVTRFTWPSRRCGGGGGGCGSGLKTDHQFTPLTRVPCRTLAVSATHTHSTRTTRQTVPIKTNLCNTSPSHTRSPHANNYLLSSTRRSICLSSQRRTRSRPRRHSVASPERMHRGSRKDSVRTCLTLATERGYEDHVRRKDFTIADLAIVSGPSRWTVAEVVGTVDGANTTILTNSCWHSDARVVG